jgi:hypothetical protein
MYVYMCAYAHTHIRTHAHTRVYNSCRASTLGAVLCRMRTLASVTSGARGEIKQLIGVGIQSCSRSRAPSLSRAPRQSETRVTERERVASGGELLLGGLTRVGMQWQRVGADEWGWKWRRGAAPGEVGTGCGGGR